jgi:nitrite reductase/ring-hydroxylating ferredoxin subunit
MARDPRLICASGALREGASGVRFELKALGGEEKGFAVRFNGTACAFVNRCPHLGTELDWQPGEFFEESGLYLVCSTHGALFEPNTGFCVAGPCHGASLEPLQVREKDGEVFLMDDIAPPTQTKTSAP